ncbi:uncharacterized protein N7482_000565 [Penicillium canariense]|uniref:DNA replication factor Cdt1 C-terminal domain-containing protein n=1 Tax=Penicillium canariense TaxID=189055 RepID=A0A9W9IDK8_9EURO|nr:uncharacterized protein N7482_000565 [Penicillium canariense]KAJ5174688.1 hypothetical protein N7482_000565 [Penicillium canariense]
MPCTARPSCPLQNQPAIQGFGRATKAGVSPSLPAKKTASLPVSPSKKRKLQELENVDGNSRQSVDEEPNTPSKTLKLSQLSVSSPRSGHYASPKRTPSRRTRVTSISTINEAPDTPSKQRTLNFEKIIPEPKLAPRAPCVNDFLNLHSAFVQALSIHLAHNGQIAPADLREFLPSVTRIWKKRKVQPKDVQRLLWVWDHSLMTKDISYRLANYGLGKVCLERVVQMNEQPPALQDAFEQALDLLWEQTEKSLEDAKEEDRPALFLESLGLAPIHESLTPFTAFQKGQQRLQDLRGGVIRMKTEKLRLEMEMGDSKPLAPAINRRQSLLERIKSKELRQSKLPPPPTKKEMLRRSASERVEEVASILALLRPAGYVGTGIRAMFANQRKPFKLDTMVQHVRDSVRIPIARDEVEACLEILADTRVAGHWVTMVTVKDMRSVVLKSCKDIAAKDIGAKVALLKAEWEKPVSCVQSSVLKI